MDLDINKMAQDCMNVINEKIKNLNTLNIIVVGKTGVGKSTLINSVFRENLSETGMGHPITKHMRKIIKKDFPLCIYDTRGLELSKNVQDEVKSEIMTTIKDGISSKNIDKTIHCIWYCINTASNRVEDKELEWLKSLAEENKTTQVPIIIILTQSFDEKKSKEMKDYILDQNLNVVQVIPVLANDYEINGEYTKKAYGLDNLIQVMSEALPIEIQNTLQNVQKASLNEKIKYARTVVATAVAAAFGEGFSPIPISDAILLVSTQMVMIGTITSIFGLNISKSVITSFISSIIGSSAATVTGKTFVSSVLKLIPGAGTIVGGIISGATASVLTMCLGEAYIKYMVKIYKGELNINEFGTKTGQENMKNLFQNQIKLKKKRYLFGKLL